MSGSIVLKGKIYLYLLKNYALVFLTFSLSYNATKCRINSVKNPVIQAALDIACNAGEY